MDPGVRLVGRQRRLAGLQSRGDEAKSSTGARGAFQRWTGEQMETERVRLPRLAAVQVVVRVGVQVNRLTLPKACGRKGGPETLVFILISVAKRSFCFVFVCF